jgi:hypothetical protein
MKTVCDYWTDLSWRKVRKHRQQSNSILVFRQSL